MLKGQSAMSPSSVVDRLRVRDGCAAPGSRTVANEIPVAIVHDASTYAVMMATPQDLEDFAIGLSLTEGVIATADEVRSIETVETDLGIELRLWLTAGRSAALTTRRRTMAGPTGCGLCGIESLEQARRSPRRSVFDIQPLTAAQIQAAMASLEPAQVLGEKTRAVHAAGFWTPSAGLILAREDVGRHNAVDKLIGGLARGNLDAAGVLVLTSRVSVELVQKAAAVGAPMIVAVSAPTQLAIQTADEAGVTLIAVARADGFEVFTHAWRFAG